MTAPPDAPAGRVLQVLQPHDGGVRQHVLHLSAELLRRGWAVDVAAEPGAVPGTPWRDALDAAGARVHLVPFDRSPWGGGPAAARALRRIERAGSYDVVHAHSSKAGALARAILPRGRPVAYTPHCFAFAAGFGPARPLYWAVEQALVPRTAALVASSEWERREAERLAGARPRTHRIHYGVPAGDGDGPVHPELARLRGRGPVTGFLARLEPQKDPLAVVRATARLAAEGRLAGPVVVAGSGRLADAVRDAVAEAGLGDRLVLLPFEGTVDRYLRGFDLFLLPSRWESLPIAVLEAMAAGLPVLASDVGGTADAVQEGVTGRLVPPDAPDALASALAAMTADAAALRAMGEAGRRRWAEGFSVERMADQVEALYRTLASPAA